MCCFWAGVGVSEPLSPATLGNEVWPKAREGGGHCVWESSRPPAPYLSPQRSGLALPAVGDEPAEQKRRQECLTAD